MRRAGTTVSTVCIENVLHVHIHTNTNTKVSNLVCTKIDAGDMDERMSMEASTRNDRLGLGGKGGERPHLSPENEDDDLDMEPNRE